MSFPPTAVYRGGELVIDAVAGIADPATTPGASFELSIAPASE